MHASWKWIVAGLLLAPMLSWATPPEPTEPEAASEPPPGVKPGPVTVELGHELTLEVPEDHVFLDKDTAAQVLEKNGSFHHENLLGMVFSKDELAPWTVIIRYDEEGYVKDDEKLDAKDILDAIKEGQEEANQERVQRGFKALAIGGWSEAPHYEPAQHHLVWGLDVQGESGTSVNYNTRVLGRRGYVSLNLVVDPQNLPESKPHVAKLLQHTTFKQGARYEDYQQGKDKAAEYGLAGLVLGGAGIGAAKLVKIGLLAKGWKLILAFILAGKKLIIVGLAGAAAFLKKLFGRKNSDNP